MPEGAPALPPAPYIAASAHLLGITLDEVWHASIMANLRVLAAAAALLTEFPLADAVDAAPRFEA